MEAKKLISIINPIDDKINFDEFKKWFIMGSHHFLLDEIYFNFENKVKMLLGKESFNIAVNKVNEQLKNIPYEKTSLNVFSSIGVQKNLVNPSKITLSIFAGDACKDILESFPSSVKSTPMTISFCFNCRGEIEAFIFSNLLKKIKQKFIQEQFELDFFSKYYLSCIIIEKTNINIRNIREKVYMDFSVSGLEADVMNNLISSFDFSLINYSILTDIIFTTEFNLMEIFKTEKNFNDILLDLLTFNFEVKGDSNKLIALSKVFVEFYKVFQNTGILTSDKQFIVFIQILRVIKAFGFSIEYDEKEFLNTLFEFDYILSGNKLKSFGENFKENYQNQLKNLLDFFPELIKDFIKDSILEDDFSLGCMLSKSIDYENFEAYFIQPGPNIVLKMNMNLKGANELIDDILKIN